MNCLSNVCYVCLKKKDKPLININSSLSLNENIIHILGYLPFNLGWLKTKRIILICEECCRRLRETYQFLIMCHKNSAVLQGYMEKINTANISNTDNEAELRVDLNNKQDDINEAKCEIKLEEIYTVEKGPIIIDETEYEFVNVEDSFVKEEDTWKMDAEDAKKESHNTHDTDTHSDNSVFTSTQVHTTNKKKLNTAAKKSHKCLTCSKSFINKTSLQTHTRVHTGGKPHKCATCEKCFSSNLSLVRHMRVHTGEKPFKCTICKNHFRKNLDLLSHICAHTSAKAYECTRCKKCFMQHLILMYHMRTHTGETPVE